MIRVCSYCWRVMGYTEQHNSVAPPTHGCCPSCSRQWNALIDKGRYHEMPKPLKRAGVPACMRRAGI